jgi:outer membrane protein assembly factor BamB
MRIRILALTIPLFIGMSVAPALQAHAAGVKFTLSPTYGPPTTKDKAKGSGFPASVKVSLTFNGTTVATATTGAKGTFSVSFVVPAIAPPGPQTVSAFDSAGLGGSATFLVQTDWNSARFDPAGSGFNPYENVLSPANVGNLSQLADPQWGAELGSAPAFSGGVIFTGSSDNTVRAFSNGGKQLWSFTTGGPVLGSPLAVVRKQGELPEDCAVVAGSEDGNVYGLDPTTGKRLWKFDAGSPISTSPTSLPAVQDGLVVTTTNGSVFALNGCTGAGAWSDKQLGDGAATSPTVLAGVKIGGSTHTIVVMCVDATPTATEDTAEAVDGVTGKTLWTWVYPAPKAGSYDSSALYGSGSAARVVLSYGSSVVELNATNGNWIWTYVTPTPVSGAVGLDFNGTVLGPSEPNAKASLYAIFVGTQSLGCMINPANGKLLWTAKSPGPVTSPAIANGDIFTESLPTATAGGTLLVLEASNGDTLFSAALGGQTPPTGQAPSPSVADGHVFAGDFTGGLRIFNNT